MTQIKDVSYRKAYKSDHLGVVDLEEMLENGKSLIVTIRDVFFEESIVVAGNKGNFNIAYFEDDGIKPLVLNATNAESIRSLCGGGTTLSTWKMPVRVELYIDSTVKMKGQIVGGVRIKREKPAIVKPPIKEADWPKAISAIKGGGTTIQAIMETRSLTELQLNELDDLSKSLK